MESALAVASIDWGLLFLHIWESIFVFLIYYPMLPVFWLTEHLAALIGCANTSDVLAILTFAGVFAALEDFYLIVGVAVAYASVLGMLANFLKCGDFSQSDLPLLDITLRSLLRG